MQSRSVLRAAPVVFLLLWSGGYTMVRIAIRHTGPLSLLAIRYVIVFAILLLAAAIVRPALPRTRGQYGQLALVGLLVQVGYFGATNLALAAGVSVAVTALIGSLQPVLVAVTSPWVLGERVGRSQWAGLVLGLAGAAVVILARSHLALSAVGVGFAVAALLAISSGTLVERRFGINHHPLASNLVQYAVGVVVAVPLAIAIEGGIRFTTATETWLALSFLVLGNSLISITLLLAMIRAGHAARVSALFFLVPPISTLYAVLLLHEAVPPIAWVGMALAGAGVWIATRASPQPLTAEVEAAEL